MTTKAREFAKPEHSSSNEYRELFQAYEKLEIELELKTIDANTMMQKIARLEATIKNIDLTLRVPAAEYVPAIQDVFQIIDDAILGPEHETTPITTNRQESVK